MKYKTLKIKLDETKSEIIRLDPKLLMKITSSHGHGYINGENGLEPVLSGPLHNHAIFLERKWDWILGKDTAGRICLVPLRKKKDLEPGAEEPK